MQIIRNFFLIYIAMFSFEYLQALTIGKERKAEFLLPSSFVKEKAYPLIVYLHGYMSDSSHEKYYIGLKQSLKEREFILLLPNGNKNSKGLRFWNANKYCCDYENSGVNDIKFIREIINEIKQDYLIDSSKIFLFGHSNGASLAYQFACDSPENISGIITYAGSSVINEERCLHNSKLTIIHIHGSSDSIVPFDDNDRYLGIENQLKIWTERKKCDHFFEFKEKFNFLVFSFYNQTDEKRWLNCDFNDKVILWKMNYAGHISFFSQFFLDTLFKEISIQKLR